MEHFTADDGVRIAFHRFGAEQHVDPLVVLHHGFAADTRFNWVSPGVVGALVTSGRSVVSIDARGHGYSDKPHDRARYGERRMAHDLVGLLDHLGIGSEGNEQIDLVGYSMGAIVALTTATIDERIRRLVIGGIGGAVVDRDLAAARRFDPTALAAALRASDADAVTNPMARAFRRFAEVTGADRLALAAQAESVDRSPIDASLVTATSLVIVGDRDELAGRPEVLADALRAELRIVEGDHLGAVAAPDFAPAIVEFLAAR